MHWVVTGDDRGRDAISGRPSMVRCLGGRRGGTVVSLSCDCGGEGEEEVLGKLKSHRSI